MILFFRKLRQRLLSENKFSKYLIYAIGEILLVVIGILIALKVNNWNEGHKDRKEEALIMQTLHDELKENLDYSTTVMESLEKRLSTTVTLMEYTAREETELAASVFDSLMVISFIFPPYSPINNDLERVLGSDQMDLIQSTELQKELSDYKKAIDQALLSYVYAEDDFKLVILPYFVKNYPLKALLKGYGLDIPETRHPRNYPDLMNSVEFENILSVIYADSAGQLQVIYDILRRIEALKNHIQSEYEIPQA